MEIGLHHVSDSLHSLAPGCVLEEGANSPLKKLNV